jgi:hypothetical protein
VGKEEIQISVVQFQIKALIALGLGIRSVSSAGSAAHSSPTPVRFSLDRGGFTEEESTDAVTVTTELYKIFLGLSEQDYQPTHNISEKGLMQLQGLVSRFVSYQLEREIKSQNHLASTAS